MVIFSHGNSFPGRTYTQLLNGLTTRGFDVKALDRFGHDPRYPVTSNWPHLVQQLADFAVHAMLGHVGPVYLLGHSLGGFVSLMCAARFPVLDGRPLNGVVMLDSPVVGGWKAQALAVAKHTQMVGHLSPGAVSRKRRHHWPDADAALAHFQHKRAFALWDPQVLADYITYGTEDVALPDGSTHRTLRFDRDVETAIYNTLPHNLDRLLRQHPVPCPVAFIGGTESAEMKQVGMTMTRKVVRPNQHPERLRMVEGTHLFPMERPCETADVVAEVLNGLLAA
ncbi:MAG: alpha/beta hydrolase [Burkholderiales bacterium]|nr:alpha/beta hydrolase [Burkholderiales bacterium]